MKALLFYIFMAISAAIAVIMFFHIDSYVADKLNINWLFVSSGVFNTIAAIYFLIQARNNSNG